VEAGMPIVVIKNSGRAANMIHSYYEGRIDDYHVHLNKEGALKGKDDATTKKKREGATEKIKKVG
jgi:hypothetical protein